ncbi:CDP-glycerol glycerophosphotransferase family protein [Halorientalis brevis]|uniref:CDP-glycerol glycerophosphotransferase family protein n=1 Tax=Halorientalis brevis TaxID=1126241 RepID=A0ABD6C702_9EURY|nr:CDP-glycerol glycerophosphotransferase family protein [Halorientalis brevis]
MPEILYTVEFPFQAKTFEAIDPHVDVASAYLPLRPAAKGCTDEIDEVDLAYMDVGYVNRQVREIDPSVVVYNHNYRHRDVDFQTEYPLVHVRHGASIGRGTVQVDVEEVFPLMDAALAPGEWWATQYRETESPLAVETVGIPEADALVDSEPPRQRRVLYAPTNTRYGQGSLCNTAEHVLDTFAGSDYHLRFRPHPHDTLEQPARSLVRKCRDRICDLPTVTFDDAWSPVESLLWADVLISDYSGTVTEWLHTGRPLLQLTDVVSETNEVPEIGTTTDELAIETVDRLYEDGHSQAERDRRDAWLDRLGIPMDGRAGRRAASVLTAIVE